MVSEWLFLIYCLMLKIFVMEKYTIFNPDNWNPSFANVELLDWSLVLTHVFGQPVGTAEAFMYIFRRYGVSPHAADDYKSLCRYVFTTGDDGVIVSWSMGTGNCHYGLSAYSTSAKECEAEWRGPAELWRQRMKRWALEQHGWQYYHIFEVFKESSDGRAEFCGTEIQKEELIHVLHENGFNELNLEGFKFLKKYKREGNDRWNDAFRQIEPFPERAWLDDVWRLKHDKPLEAARIQHEYFMSLPDGSPLRRVYLAVLDLFSDWKRPVRVRDQFFNLAGAESETNSFPQTTDPWSGEPCTDVADYSVP